MVVPMLGTAGGTPGFAVRVEADPGGALVFRLRGDLDEEAAPHVRHDVGPGLRREPVVIDLTGVSFIDSSGMGALLGAIRRIHEAGARVAVVAVNPPMVALLHTIGVDRLVPVEHTLGAAVARIPAGRPAHETRPVTARPGPAPARRLAGQAAEPANRASP